MREGKIMVRKLPALPVSALLAALIATACAAAPGTPNYYASWTDAVTGDNQFSYGGKTYWDVDVGADSYQDDVYERPTAQTFAMKGARYAAKEYLGYLDITGASIGWDTRYIYVQVALFSLNKVTDDGVATRVGLVERYGFRLGWDEDGRHSRLFVADQPELKNSPNTQWGSIGTFAYRDTDGYGGGRGALNGHLPSGRTVTKSDNSREESGMNGYNSQIISDGKPGGSGSPVFFTRISPASSTVVEFALDYLALGWTEQSLWDLQYVEFEAIKGGAKDPQNYLWNDKYTKSEAGSPNPGVGGLSEFGTQGCGNIYELDTLRGGVVPEPSSMLALAACLIGMAGASRRRR